jgi:uncharacterized OB-fold protein
MTRHPVTEGLFSLDDPITLLGSRCHNCGGYHFPRHETCPYCSTEGAEPVELSRSGVLWAWTAVTAAPPGYNGAVPFGFGVVELPEGIRVITLLTESDPAALSAGAPMTLVRWELATNADGAAVTTYAFGPAA